MDYSDYYVKKLDISNILTKKLKVELWLSLDQLGIVKKALEDYSKVLDKSPYGEEKEEKTSWDSPENFKNK